MVKGDVCCRIDSNLTPALSLARRGRSVGG
jgi:hypothetical protein